MSQSRRADPNGDGYKQRSAFEKYKLVVFVVAAIVGPTGITGLMNAYTDPNIKLQGRVDAVEVKQGSQDLLLNGVKGKQALREMRVENYIKSHNETVQLRQEMTDKDIKHMMELLNEIKDDVKTRKNGN